MKTPDLTAPQRAEKKKRKRRSGRYGGRPNMNRARMNVCLGPIDHERIEKIKKAYGFSVNADAIRKALEIVAEKLT